MEIVKGLYQKANKTQEEWITPTMQNSWVEYSSSYPVRYKKDEMGFVHIKGRIKSGTLGQGAFTLPEGYRPPNEVGFAVFCSGSTLGLCVVTAAGVVLPAVGNTTYMTLDTIYFSVV